MEILVPIMQIFASIIEIIAPIIEFIALIKQILARIKQIIAPIYDIFAPIKRIIVKNKKLTVGVVSFFVCLLFYIIRQINIKNGAAFLVCGKPHMTFEIVFAEEFHAVGAQSAA